MNVHISKTKDISQQDIIAIYEANHWSSAKKPDKLYQALLNSPTLVSAWEGDRLIGIANALTDGFLVVYYPHMLVHPDYQGKGIGKMMMEAFQEIYSDFHQQILVADGKAINFYEQCGFSKAGETQSMWIYQGDEH
ncbi:MAG: GNAT family N-acetyltransferase [Bacteroidota bacterium]